MVHKTGVSSFLDNFKTEVFAFYKKVIFYVFYHLQGYLTESGYVNLQRVQMIMLAVGEVEDSIFKKRKDDEVKCFYCSS